DYSSKTSFRGFLVRAGREPVPSEAAIKYQSPPRNPRNWANDRAANMKGDTRPTAGSLAKALIENGIVLRPKADRTIGISGSDLWPSASATKDAIKQGANRSWSFINCGVWLSRIALPGLLRTANTRQ